MSLVGQKVSDSRVLKLIEAFLKQGVLDGLRKVLHFPRTVSLMRL